MGRTLRRTHSSTSSLATNVKRTNGREQSKRTNGCCSSHMYASNRKGNGNPRWRPKPKQLTMHAKYIECSDYDQWCAKWNESRMIREAIDMHQGNTKNPQTHIPNWLRWTYTKLQIGATKEDLTKTANKNQANSQSAYGLITWWLNLS